MSTQILLKKCKMHYVGQKEKVKKVYANVEEEKVNEEIDIENESKEETK